MGRPKPFPFLWHEIYQLSLSICTPWLKVAVSLPTPNNLPIWKFVTKSHHTNEHMREVINHLTYTHLLNTIKSIITQTLEKICKKRVYGKKTLTTCISETLKTKLIMAS